MNYAKVHIFFSLIYFVALPLSTVLLTIAHIKKNEVMLKTSLIFLILTSFSSFISYFSGNPTMQMLAGFPAVTEEVIDVHQNSAYLLLYLSIGLSVVSAVGFLLIKNNYFIRVLILLSVLVSAYQIHTSILGLKIRHTEIRDQKQNFNKVLD